MTFKTPGQSQNSSLYVPPPELSTSSQNNNSSYSINSSSTQEPIRGPAADQPQQPFSEGGSNGSEISSCRGKPWFYKSKSCLLLVIFTFLKFYLSILWPKLAGFWLLTPAVWQQRLRKDFYYSLRLFVLFFTGPFMIRREAGGS